jgi:ABC-type cobalamin transport system ATPase subunit
LQATDPGPRGRRTGLEQVVIECAPGSSISRSTGVAEEVMFVLAGSGELSLAGERYPLEPETGAYLAPGEEYVVDSRGFEPLREDLERVQTLFPRLEERKDQLAGTLSGGEQQMVAMGRALMSRPRLLLMDEPSMGLSPALVQQNFRIIKEVHESGVAILMVEQNANMALSIADRGYVLATGNVVLKGSASELLHHEDLKRAYLGR